MPMPAKLRDRIDILIRTGAAELKHLKSAEYQHGLRNQTIADHVQAAAEAVLARHHKATISFYLSTRIPLVLAKRAMPGDDVHVIQSCLPELKLPEWVNIPSTIDGDVKYGGWKLEIDATPDELQRLIDHRDEIIRGHEVERNKYVLLRSTALKKGCALDKPIRTVFFPDKEPPPASSPELHP